MPHHFFGYLSLKVASRKWGKPYERRVKLEHPTAFFFRKFNTPKTAGFPHVWLIKRGGSKGKFDSKHRLKIWVGESLNFIQNINRSATSHSTGCIGWTEMPSSVAMEHPVFSVDIPGFWRDFFEASIYFVNIQHESRTPAVWINPAESSQQTIWLFIGRSWLEVDILPLSFSQSFNS